jgi:hypothetical protein
VLVALMVSFSLCVFFDLNLGFHEQHTENFVQSTWRLGRLLLVGSYFIVSLKPLIYKILRYVFVSMKLLWCPLWRSIACGFWPNFLGKLWIHIP